MAVPKKQSFVGFHAGARSTSRVRRKKTGLLRYRAYRLVEAEVVESKRAIDGAAMRQLAATAAAGATDCLESAEIWKRLRVSPVEAGPKSKGEPLPAERMAQMAAEAVSGAADTKESAEIWMRLKRVGPRS